MINKFASIVLVAALVCTLAGRPAFADTPKKPGVKTPGTTVRSGTVTEVGRVANEELRAEILKLVADAKAEGNVVKFPRPQIQPTHRNNLSQGAKIAIGVAIAVAVVTVILVSKRCDNEPGAC
ncbi:MAG: hypothetical protein ACR2H6_10420 [Pyrinomonadaceae bacterium]